MKRNFKANSLEQERVDRRELANVQGGGDVYCGCACAGGYMSEMQWTMVQKMQRWESKTDPTMFAFNLDL